MRFSKRGKNPLAWGRRAQSGQEGEGNERTAVRDEDLAEGASSSEEEARQAPSRPPAPEEGAVATSSASMSAGDPTQQLLAALGRFQRQVARARDGAPQQIWSDECMNQLIAAVRIALTQDWDDVVESLTETARVLHTYEQAGKAAHCVDFLADSYEILCLMVGDLLVGRVRPGVLAKWRDRYERAVAELEQEGLQLVEDEGSEGGPLAQEPQQSAAQEAPEASPPSIHDLPPMTPDAEESEDEEAPVDEAALDLDIAPGIREEDAPGFPLDEQDDEAQSEWPPRLEAAAAPPEAGAAADGPAPAVAAQLDTMCDALARISSGDEPETGFYFDAILETVDRIEAAAAAEDNETAVELCGALRELCGEARDREVTGDAPFFDLAYAFSGLFAEVMEDGEAAQRGARDWMTECSDQLRAWGPSGPEEEAVTASAAAGAEEDAPSLWEAAEPDDEAGTAEEPPADEAAMEEAPPEDAAVAEAAPHPAAGPEPESPAAESGIPADAAGAALASLSDGQATRILRDAEGMIREGKAGDAKLMLLQAAAEIARSQAEQAESEVRSVEQRLQDERNALHQAHESVSSAESSVTHAEEAVRQSERTLEQRRSRTGEVVDERRQTEGRIHELEQRIRDLQEQRKAELGRLEEIDVTLEGERQKERDAQSDLGRLQHDEEQSRVRLEDSRQEVRNLEQRLKDTEKALHRAQNALKRQHGSLADIQETVNLAGGASGEDVEEDD